MKSCELSFIQLGNRTVVTILHGNMSGIIPESCLLNKKMPRYKSNVQKSIELTSLYVTRTTFDTQTLSEVNLWIPKTSAQVYDSHRSIPCLDTILVIYVRQFKTILIHG